jgi:phosphonate transport system substrate-binding protein
MKRTTVAALVIISIMALLLAGCGTPKLGTADNPIVMSFVPSGDTQEIIASGDTLAKMVSDKTGLTVTANVGTDFAAVREAMGANKAQIGWLNTFLKTPQKWGP